MNFSEREINHISPALVWFELSLDPIEPENKQNKTKILLLPSGKPTNLHYDYELDLIVHMRTDSCLVEGKELRFGIKKGFLELLFVNCILPRSSWTLLSDIKDSTFLETERVWAKGAKVSVSSSKLSVNAELGETRGGKEKIIYELTQAEMRGTENNPYIEFTAQEPDRYDNRVFNGKYGKTLGNLNILAPKSEVHCKFRVDLDGLCATHYNGKPILKPSLVMLLTRFLSKLLRPSDPVKDKLQIMAGELSYVKLCS